MKKIFCAIGFCGFYEKEMLKYFCIVTSAEIIDIISTFEPNITKVSTNSWNEVKHRFETRRRPGNS
jgi:hypothetical protein